MTDPAILPTPETVQAAAPAINWLFEFMKVATGPLLTGFFVLVAARLAFYFANQGRQYDILYKERFNSNQRVIGLLYKLRRSLHKLYSPLKTMKFGEELSEYSDPSEALKALEKVLEMIDDLGESLVLLKPEVRESLNKLIVDCHLLIPNVEMLLRRSGSKHLEEGEINYHENIASEMAGRVAALYRRGSLLIDDAYLSLNLPGSKPIFPNIVE